MDYHRLTRRELQALCKKNKIPANMTNVAMADSLKALEIVEGIEEFLPCVSETAQSSIESPVRSEVTSPCVPSNGGRSTRRRNVAKQEPETVKQSARTQSTTRKTQAKYADELQAVAIETPAVVQQTSRRKGQITSACRKMDFQAKECIEEEKKDVFVTPAPSAVTTRRRQGAREESAVNRVYSTRRSARLAEKNVQLLNDAGNENLAVSKKNLFTNEEPKINGTECHDLDEMSGITGGVDVDIAAEENSEQKDAAEVVSAYKQVLSAVNEVDQLPSVDEETCNHSEADIDKPEPKESGEIEAEPQENCDEREAPDDENRALLEGMTHHSEADEDKSELKDSGDMEIEEAEFGFENEAEPEKAEGDETESPNDGKENGDKREAPGDENLALQEGMTNQSDADGDKLELKDSFHVEIEEVRIVSEIEAEPKKAKCDETESPNDEKENCDEREATDDENLTLQEGMVVMYEADRDKSELKDDGDVEIEEVQFGSEIETEPENAICDEIESPNYENLTQENDGPRDFQTSEINIEVENIELHIIDVDAEFEDQAVNHGENHVLESEQDTDKDAGFEEEASSCGENSVHESEGNDEIADVPCDVNFLNEIEKDISDDNELDTIVKDLNVNEVMEINGSRDFQPSEIKIEVERTEEPNIEVNDQAANSEGNAGLETEEQNADKDVGFEDAVFLNAQSSEIKIELEKIEEVTDKDAGIEDLDADSGENAGLETEEQNADRDVEFEDAIFLNVQSSGIKIELEKIEEVADKDAGFEDLDADSGENAGLESEEQYIDEDAVCEDDIAIVEFSCNIDIHVDEIDKIVSNVNGFNSEDVTVMNVDEEPPEINADVHEDSSEKESSLDALGSAPLEARGDDPSAEMPFNISLMNEKEVASRYVSEKQDGTNLVKDNELELRQPIIQVSPGKDLDNVTVEMPPCLVQPTFLTPVRESASKVLSAKKKRITAVVPDNKENIGSEGKLIVTVKTPKKKADKNGPDLQNLSMRKLTKMLKDKLQITDKPIEKENDSEVAPARQALQVLPENR